MNQFFATVQNVLNLGATVILPIMITIMALFFRMNFVKALKAALLVSVGFAGLNLVTGLLSTTINPAVEYYSAIGTGFTVVDIDGAGFGAQWAAPFAALVVIVGVILNVLLIRFTNLRILNIDIWNYVKFLVPGSIAWAIWGNFWLGFAISLATSVIALYLSQLFASKSKWEEYFGLEGTTCTTFDFITGAWWVFELINKVIDLIPGLNKLNLNMQERETDSKWSILGEPVFAGLFVGILLALITKQPYGTVLTMGFGMAAVMFLLPRMVSIMMEGLSSVGIAMKDYAQKKMGGGKELLIGMDVATGLGDSCAITTSIISMPIVVLLAFIFPGLNYFPIMQLSGIYAAVMAAMVAKGNLIRSTILMAVYNMVIFITASFMQPEFTIMMEKLGIPAGNCTMGIFDPIALLVTIANRLFGG